MTRPPTESAASRAPRRPTGGALVLLLSLGAVLGGQPSPARADGYDDPDAGHGAYGRFDADVVLALDAGAGARTDGDAVAVADLRARYLDSAGLVLGAERTFASERLHLLAAVEVRPLFLLRFFLDAELGDAWLDLLLDSVGLELGVTWADAGDHARAAAGLVVGGGLEIPLYLRRGRGVALRVAVRHAGAGASWERGPPDSLDDTTVYAAVVVRTSARAGIASAER